MDVILYNNIQKLKNAFKDVEDLKDEETSVLSFSLEDGIINSNGENVDEPYFTDSSCRSAGYIDIKDMSELHLKFERKENAPFPEGETGFYNYILYYTKEHTFILRKGGKNLTEIDDKEIPAEARYARVSFAYTRANDVLERVITGVEYIEASKVVTVVNAIKNLCDERIKQLNFDYTLERGAINSSGTPVDDQYTPGDNFYLTYCCRTNDYIDVSGAGTLTVKLTRASGAILPPDVLNFYTFLFFYDTSKTFISRTGGAGITEINENDIPTGAKYAKISFTYTRLQDVAYSCFTGTKIIGSNIPIIQTVKRLDEISITVPKKGIVLGDSISFGLWSYWDGDQRKNADDIYPNIEDTAAPIRISDWLAQYYGIPFDNIAKRGTGWVADSRNLGNAWAKAQATDFSNYDIVALCFGVNDYIQKCTMGTIANNTVGTIIGNMIHALEKIYTDNPLAKVVVFSPLNCWGQCRSTVQNPVYYGDASTHYALGYDFSGTSFTLQALIDNMQSVCDAYDVRHVVMSQGCTINMFNIKDILIDGLHPSQESMKSIASDMYHEMMFR